MDGYCQVAMGMAVVSVAYPHRQSIASGLGVLSIRREGWLNRNYLIKHF